MTGTASAVANRHPRDRSTPGRAFVFDKPCYVYLAVHRAQQRFKIGVSIDPLSRFQQLPEAGDIDLTVTLVRRLPSKGRAVQVERSLHRALDPYRLQLAHRGDGDTEWFGMEAFARASVLIDAMPDAVLPAQSLARRTGDAQRNEYVRIAEANVGQTMKALTLWRLAGGLMDVTVHEGIGQSWLVIRHFRPDPLRAATGLRAALLDLEDSYRLRTLARSTVPASLVRLVSYEGADLRIDLQRKAVLGRLPGGAKLTQALQDGLGAIRLECRTPRSRPPRLTEEQINAGLERLLERHADDPPASQSLWE